MPPKDTSEEAWQVQLEVYRRLEPIQRLKIALELSDLSRSLLKKGVERQNPGLSRQQVEQETHRLWLRSSPPARP